MDPGLRRTEPKLGDPRVVVAFATRVCLDVVETLRTSPASQGSARFALIDQLFDRARSTITTP